MKKVEKTISVAGRDLKLRTGDIAGQANGAVMASYGETVVLATVVAQELRDDPGYFPLTVEYQEKLYAGGRIKGSRWVKREGKPSDDEILIGRLIDRSIRPLFPNSYMKDVQVVITVLSVDLQNSPDFVAAVAAVSALSISDIPWDGPVGIVRVGKVGDKLTINPTVDEMETSDLDLVVSSTNDAVIMIEAGANEINEKEIVEAIEVSQVESKKIIKFISDFAGLVGIKKQEVSKGKPNAELRKKIEKLTNKKLADLASKMATKEAGYSDYDALKDAVIDELEGDDKKEISAIFEELFKEVVRESILSGKRPDGRKHDEIRSLSVMVGVLPRTHGSAIFNRGQTQALTISTLGSRSLGLTIESAEGEETKRYIHHYSMPPYSSGETGRMGSPKRREIGHGALAERALLPVIPSLEEFAYTMLVVTEILSSNGSTSMASVCGSTLSLMDAGVPIKAPVGGIAMGLVIKNQKEFAILTDIVGVEDGSGDMDFKVAGTKDGITALQLDVKTLNLTLPILGKALAQAKDARLQILDVMGKVINKSREKVSDYAPKIKLIQIDTDKIGELIGPGGKTIKGIIAKTGAQVDVEDDGSVSISAQTETEMEAAITAVEGLTKDVEPDEVYDGEVKRIQPFGAFVEILPGKEGLVYISDMSTDYVKHPGDIVNEGDKVKVRVKEIDKLGRINLSMILDKTQEKKSSDRPQRREYSKDSNDRGRNRGYSRGFNKKSFDKNQGGPHFPASRLMNSKKDFSR
jgi:polyribonucleotide nucleotidyltransferase